MLDITDLDSLVDALSTPSEAVVTDLADLDGDLVLLGVGGKLGPELAVMARRALDKAGSMPRAASAGSA